MDYEEVLGARNEYIRKLNIFCYELKYELKITGEVKPNCKGNVVIRTFVKLSDEKLEELKQWGVKEYTVCQAREDFPYNYILKGA